MPHVLVYKRWLVVSVAGVLVLAACGTAPGGAPASGHESVMIERDITWGGGPFILDDPKAGLADLPSYTATLTLAFEGTKDGQAHIWSKTYTMLRNQKPDGRLLSLEQTGDLQNLDTLYRAERGGVGYAWQEQNDCLGQPIKEGDSLADQLEPAGFLSVVVGADEAGVETVNGVASDHYTFDEQAIALRDLTQTTGELWVATDGGYVVKYVATSSGKGEYFGEGIEGTLTQDYELTAVGEPVDIRLPDECPPGMVDAPALPDAANVRSSPGFLSFQSAMGLEDAVAFYEKELPASGWQKQDDSNVTDKVASLHFLREDEDLDVFISTGDGSNSVTIQLGRAEK